jgi:long-chain acyl-CoA synthetase
MTAPSERTPLACLYHWERSAADAIHFTQPIGDGKVVDYSWKQIMHEVRRMAAHLQSLNLPPKSQIAILGKNSAHWIMADWAIWMAGHVTVPLYPTLAADTVRYILEHSESKLLFVGKLDEWRAMKSGVPADLPVITLPLAPQTEGESWDAIVARTAPLQGEPDRDLDELATIVYTSGSTGQPKGVMQNFRSFYICGTLLQQLFPLSTKDRMLSYLPLAHVAERLVVENNSTYHGFRVYFAEALDTFVADLRRAQPTMFFSVPRLWTKFHLAVCDKLPLKKQKLLFRIPVLGRKIKRKILEQLGLQDVRYAFTGAAPLPPPILAWYRSLGLDLLEAFGMSENFAYSHFTRPGDARTGYVGPPNPGVECRIDPDSGEVLVKSPAQMMGYYKEPAKTAECYTADGFFRTGDMGEVDAQNRLRVTGRVKDLFKTSKGKYVAPVPIENKLGAHPKLEAVCVGGANQSATFALALLAEDVRKNLANENRDALAQDLSNLVNEINQSLDPHEQLQFLVIVNEPWSIDNGFLTPTMKIRRNVIEKHYEPKVDRWFAARQPVIWDA